MKVGDHSNGRRRRGGTSPDPAQRVDPEPADPRKPRRLHFKQCYLEAVFEGRKTTTIRKARLVKNLKPGDPLVLTFGNRVRPKASVQAECTQVLSMDIEHLSPAQRHAIARSNGFPTWEAFAPSLASDYIQGEPATICIFRQHNDRKTVCL